MILVDTSIWVGHLNRGNAQLAALLDPGEVICHPHVIGELACGRIGNRREILGLLRALPQTPVAEHGELLHLIDTYRLWGQGLGWIDLHMLGAALLSASALWTADRALAGAAHSLGIAAVAHRPR